MLCKNFTSSFKQSITLVVGVILLSSASIFSSVWSDEQWLIGKWRLVYDPDEVKTDYIEFLPNGDVFNIWSDGTRVPGIYIVSENSVKAVFTYNDKDLIATFHFDNDRSELRIVTSDTGKESIYKKGHNGL